MGRDTMTAAASAGSALLQRCQRVATSGGGARG